MPCIIPSRRGHERTNVMSLGSRSMRRFSPFPWESATTISVAPAARAASMAALTSFVMNWRKSWYSKPVGPSWSLVTAPTTPSMSAEMCTFSPSWALASAGWSVTAERASSAAVTVSLIQLFFRVSLMSFLT